MPESPLYADFTMASATDGLFRWLAADRAADWADGDSTAPTGWFTLIQPTRDEIARYVSEEGDPRISDGSLVKADQWYLSQINDDGLIWAHSYEGLDGLRPESEQYRRALADFNRLTRIYSGWLGGTEAL